MIVRSFFHVSRFKWHNLSIRALVRAADDQSATKLMTSIKGIGPWSAQIFLMFNLGRLDIFPIGDLILNRAIRKLYEAQPGEEASVAERWTPYRSIASMHLWRWTDDS